MMNMFKGKAKPQTKGKPVVEAEERIFSVCDKRAGRIINRTWQRSRTRSKKSGRTLGKGLELADGKFRSNFSLALSVKLGMKADKVPALACI